MTTDFEQAHAISQYVASVQATVKTYTPALSTVGPGVRAEIVQAYAANLSPHDAAVKFIANRQGNS